MKDYDVIIIGKGPAGVSCALYTARANLKTLILGTDKSYLEKTEKIDNFYGFPEGISGKELFENGIRQAKYVGADVINEEVTSINPSDGFNIKTSGGDYHAKTLLIATGNPPRRPNIKGVGEFEGKGISYCTTCDGFFYRNKKVGVLGNGDYAVEEAAELEPFTKDITIFTNGEELNLSGGYKEKAEKYKIEKRKILEVMGEATLSKIKFEDGEEPLDGLFIAAATASSVDFAVKLGVSVKDGAVEIDESGMTNLPGIFAAGDCTGGFKQVATAVGEGAIAGKSMIEYVRKNK